MQRNPSPEDDRVSVAASTINGKGVFAVRDFAPNEKILVWQEDAFDFCIFLNHSCAPSCYTRQPTDTWSDDVLYAGPNGLKKGEEVTFDYRLTRWSALWKETVKNRCGCPKCR